MEALIHPCWNRSALLHKLCLYSGWSRSACCLTQSVHNASTGGLSCSRLHRSSGHCKEASFGSHHSNFFLTLKNHDLHNNSNTVFTQRTIGLHTLPKASIFRNFDSEGSLKDLCSRNNLILSRGWSRSSRSERNDDDTADPGKLEHRYLMERLASENDMLSRFRNTYIMTLVSLASLQFDISQIPSAIGAVAIVTAELNLTVATVIYISNLLMFRRDCKLLGTSFLGRVLFAIAHFVLWTLLLTLLFPDGNQIDEELKRYTGDDN
ncbi:uncharacterized protein LOC123530418 [Mercenaria mercenaria]|uniref:uncharacterized protein LOC123530418 n=1 Tax=Mercenaria mercenaria TaxID=6596 RepID=UPI00234EF38C|nr:uncharacterized protein LOC123530418 [Mercenaria mercenaria]XP_045167148.2 uncharacterized protein LOC123530418 [Mercenaria mercenaria]XP_045167156.2 uncharacterized protein LOC123530418 [Mercenaria mercenaria]